MQSSTKPTKQKKTKQQRLRNEDNHHIGTRSDSAKQRRKNNGSRHSK